MADGKDEHEDEQKGAGATGDVQGEGDYAAARRYRQDTERFIEQGKVKAAAARAQPADAREAQSLQQAEEIGRARARGEDEHDEFTASERSKQR